MQPARGLRIGFSAISLAKLFFVALVCDVLGLARQYLQKQFKHWASSRLDTVLAAR